jgi:hypothetical protein
MIIKEAGVEEIKKEELEKFCYEEYELRFYHNFINGKGERCKAEEPVVTRYVVMMEKQDYGVPRPYLVNEMLDRIREYMVSKLR